MTPYKLIFMSPFAMHAFAWLLFFLKSQVKACTTFVVGRLATTDGSVMTTHSNDGGGTTDPRLVKIPSRDYPEGSMRPIWASPENYPRYVGMDRNAEEYFSENCLAGPSNCNDFKPIGYIPQVNHTLAYFEGTYGIQNEMQVGIAESTCSGVFAAKPIQYGGKALLSIDQLSQIAMERSYSAREAVTIMGSLAEQYGFYGESFSFEGGSESLMVIDPNESWVFHILADPSGTSAIWVAARVPDDSVAVVANMFSIREVNLSDSANFLGRQDMWDVAKAYNLWSEGDPKDFTATFSDGEYAHKYYSGRRMWGVYRLLAPSANLPSEYDNLKTKSPYPFSVKVDKPVSLEDMFAVMRDWYNGTEYSTSSGLQGGAFGSPDRYSGGQGESTVQGNWERTITIFRSSDTFIVQARSWLPNEVGGVIWFGPSAAHATVYLPILAGMTKAPRSLSSGWQGTYDLTQAYWINRIILNLAQIKFDYMITDIKSTQSFLESRSQDILANVSLTFSKAKSLTQKDRDYLDGVFGANAEYAVLVYNQLASYLLFTYADGEINYWTDKSFHSQSTGYPAWWLEAVGYEEGPPPVELTPMMKAIQMEVQKKSEPLLQRNKSFFMESIEAIKPPTEIQLKKCISSCHINCANPKNCDFSVCMDQCFKR